MHELSIAQSILEIVEQYVIPADRETVRQVKIRVGEMAGVVPDSLEFCFSAIIADTPLRSASLHIQEIPFTISCVTCGDLATNPSGFVVCPKCGGADTKIISGTELQVIEIELADSAEVL